VCACSASASGDAVTGSARKVVRHPNDSPARPQNEPKALGDREQLGDRRVRRDCVLRGQGVCRLEDISTRMGPCEAGIDKSSRVFLNRRESDCEGRQSSECESRRTPTPLYPLGSFIDELTQIKLSGNREPIDNCLSRQRTQTHRGGANGASAGDVASWHGQETTCQNSHHARANPESFRGSRFSTSPASIVRHPLPTAVLADFGAEVNKGRAARKSR
jgi:hypothetical protein